MIFPEGLKDKFGHYVADRCGLYFKDHDLKDLENSIAARMASHGFDSAVSYYSYLTLSDKKEDEFRELVNLLTVNHTYFFRNEPQFMALKEKVLPEIIGRKLGHDTRPRLRIWSAGCSTGEEPYTIAMIVSDCIPDLENWDVQILATDASEKALAAARNGEYSENSIKHVPTEYLNNYFTYAKSSVRNPQYTIHDSIRKMVTFGYFNLMDEDYPEGFDIIFCRNVVIYFEFETMVRVMNKFYSSLLDAGYLFIGYSETLQFMRDKFRMLTSHDGIYYCKTKAVIEEAAEEMKEKEEKEEIDIDRILEDISRQELEAELVLEAKKKPEVTEDRGELLVQVIKYMHLKEYDQALELIREALLADEKNPELYYLAAEILMNQGRAAEAKKRLFQALKVNSFFAPAHYLLGCIYMQEEKFDEAKEDLKKALYLDGYFLMAHFYMAHIFRSGGNLSESIREYRNTLKLLSKYSATAIIPYSGGFNATTLASVCRDNLERLKVMA